MAKEIIRVLGQMNPTLAQEFSLYIVPEGHRGVISSIIITDLAGAGGTYDVAVYKNGGFGASGKSTSVTANKLNDSAAKFQNGRVNGGDIVQEITGSPAKQTTVTGIDSEIVLSITDDLFTSIGFEYVVYPLITNQPKHFIRKTHTLAVNDSDEIKAGITLQEFDHIRILSSTGDMAFSIFGSEITANG